jgi:hypothetical protein
MSGILLALVLLGVAAADARGQIDELERGDRVRISIANLETTSQWRVGRLSQLDSTTVTIIERANGRPLSLPLSDLGRFQRSLGRNTGRAVRWIGGGSAFGFVVGAGLTLISGDDTPNESAANWINAGVGFAVVGGVIGGIVGFREQWGDVVVRVSLVSG